MVAKWQFNKDASASNHWLWKLLSDSRNSALPKYQPYSNDDMKPNGAAAAALEACNVTSVFFKTTKDNDRKVKSLAFSSKSGKVIGLNSHHDFHDLLLKLVYTPKENVEDAVSIKLSTKGKTFTVVAQDFDNVAPITIVWVAAQKLFGHGRQRKPSVSSMTRHVNLVSLQDGNYEDDFVETAVPYANAAAAEAGFSPGDQHGFTQLGWFQFYQDVVDGDEDLRKHFSSLAKTPPAVLFHKHAFATSGTVLTVQHEPDKWIQNQWLVARHLHGDQHWVPSDFKLPSNEETENSGNPVTDSLADGTELTDDATVPMVVELTQNISEFIQNWDAAQHEDDEQRVSSAGDLWANIITSFTEPLIQYKDLVEFSNKSPLLFAKFLRASSPVAREALKGLKDDQIDSKEVARAFSTAVYEIVQPKLLAADNAYYEAALGKVQGSCYKQARGILKILCGLIHFLLCAYPDRFPHFIAAIKHLNEFRKEYKIPSPQYFGAAQFGFPFKMPFESWKCLLRVFGVTPRGHVCGAASCTDKISMLSVNNHMEAVEKVFFRNKPSYVITLEDGSAICNRLLRLHPVIWKLSERQSPLDYYSLLTAGVDMIGKDDKFTMKDLKDLMRECKDQIEEPDFDDGQYSDEEAPDGEVPISDLCQPLKAKLAPAEKKTKKTKQRQFPPDPRLACIQEAASFVLDKWNKDGRPLDIQLASGRAIHAEFGKEVDANAYAENYPTMIAKLVKLGAGDAPCVVGFTNGVSSDFLGINNKLIDETPLVLDTHGDGHSSCVGSFFHCHDCPRVQGIEFRFMGPHMKLGRHNSIVSKQADKFQSLKNAFAAEIVNTILDAANALLQKVAKKSDPPGAVKKMGLDKIKAQEKAQATDAAPTNPPLGDNNDLLQPSITAAVPDVSLNKMAAKLSKARYDRAILAGVQYYPRQIPNEIITKVGPQATFSEHQDHQNNINSDLSCLRDCAANGDILPIQEDFPVVTFISGTGSVPVRVQWSRAGKPLGFVDTDAGSIHLQLPGANYHSIKHGSFEIRPERSTLPQQPESPPPSEFGVPAYGVEDDEKLSLSLDTASLSGSLRHQIETRVTSQTKLRDLEVLMEKAHACSKHPLDGSWNWDLPPDLKDGHSFAGFRYFKMDIFRGTTNDNNNGHLSAVPLNMKPLPIESTMAQLGLFSKEDDDNDDPNAELGDEVKHLFVYLTLSDEAGDLFCYRMGKDSPTVTVAGPNRIIETFRMVACPQCNPWSYLSGVSADGLLGPNSVSKHPFCKYDRVNVLTKFDTIPNVMPTPNSDGTDDPEHTRKHQKTRPTLLRADAPKKFDTLDAISLNAYIEAEKPGVRQIERPAATVALHDSTRRKTVNHYAVVKHAISKGVVLEVVDGNGDPVKDQPLFMLDGKLLQPGAKLPLRKLPFKVTNQNMTVVHPDYSNVFLIVHAYKNDPRTFKLAHEVATMFQEMDLSVEENRIRFIEVLSKLEEMGLVMNGFGGSAQKSDTHISGAKSVRIDDPTFKIGDYQSSNNKETMLFMRAFDKHRPVAIFLVESKFAPEEKNFHKYEWQSPAGKQAMNDDDHNAEMEDATKSNDTNAEKMDISEEANDDDQSVDIEEDNESVVFEANPPLDGDTDAPVVGSDGDDCAKDSMTFLGYFQPEHMFKKEFDHAFVNKQFEGMENYRKAENFNITHMIYQAFRFVMTPWFSAEELLLQWKNRDNPPTFTKVQVWELDSRPMSVNYEDLVEFLREEHPQHQFFLDQDPQLLIDDPFLGVPRLKIEHVQNYYFKKILIEPEDIKEVFESVRDPNTGYVDKEKSRFLFSPLEVLSILPYVTGSGSYRQQRRHIVHTDKEGNPVEEGDETARKMFCTPLVQEESDLLPDPLRLSPLPMPNQDFDVNAQAVAQNNRTLLEQHFAGTATGESIGDEGSPPKVVERTSDGSNRPLSYCDLDLKIESNCGLLANMLFAAIVFRFTGRVDLLRHWDNPEHKDKGIFLPTLGTAEEFVHYLESHLLINNPNKLPKAQSKKKKSVRNNGSKKKARQDSNVPKFHNYTYLQSGQHQRTIPAFPSNEMFLRFIRVLGSDTSEFGFKRVKDYIVTAGKNGNTLDRKPLTELLVKVVSQCGNLQGNDKLNFIVNKAILDVRCVLVNFVTKMTLDLVHMGWGSQQGLDCIKLLRKGTMMERFKIFHTEFLALLMKQSEDYLNSIGYKRIYLGSDAEGNSLGFYIGSLFSGRPYEMCDTEHILCKIWLAVIHSHQSRNLSKAKHQHSNHTWPLPEILPWEVHLSPLMLLMWKSFCKIRSEHQYPNKLQFYFGKHGKKTKKGNDKNINDEEGATTEELAEELA